jgi:hypothetical protein
MPPGPSNIFCASRSMLHTSPSDCLRDAADATDATDVLRDTVESLRDATDATDVLRDTVEPLRDARHVAGAAESAGETAGSRLNSRSSDCGTGEATDGGRFLSITDEVSEADRRCDGRSNMAAVTYDASVPTNLLLLLLLLLLVPAS